MEPDKIAQGYDQIAAQWASDSFPKENGISQHERAIAFLKEKRSALDIGCGSSGRLIDLLLTHGFHVEGVDISQQMLSLTRERHPDVNFYHADICKWTIPGKYDLISAWDSIWHVPLSEQEHVMTKIVESLESGGVFIFTTGGVDRPGEKTDSFMGPEMYYSVLGIPKLLALLDSLGCVCRHLEYDQYPEQHVYVIAQKA
jgi:SAM-dependent methyltransferase